MKKNTVLITLFLCGLIAIAFLFLLLRNKNSQMTTSAAFISCVCTTGIVADAVQQVVGEYGQVYALMGSGVDPHTYHARESDVRRLAEATIIFYNGLHLEGKMGQLFEKMSERVPVCAVSDGIDRNLLRTSSFDQAYDPHVWFDVALWIMCVQKIASCLSEVAPQHAEYFSQRAHLYIQELEKLDRYIKERVAELPDHKKVLITAHDAFSYFGRRYGFEIVSLQGISTDSEVGTGDVMRVVSYIVKNDIPALFAEASIPRRNIEAIQAAVSAQGKEVSVGPELYSDTLGEPGTLQETYSGMVRSVTDRIVDALQGKGRE